MKAKGMTKAMKTSVFAGALTLALTGTALLAGCVSVPDEHYYTLIGKSDAAAEADDSAQTLHVNLASVTIPEAVDRAELVVRSGSNAMQVMDTHRWAESLKSEIPRALANGLGHDLPGAIVSVQADNASRDAKYQLYVDITRFDSVLGEAAAIDAFWSLRRANGDSLRSGQTSIRVPVQGSGFDGLVAAHAQALAQLSAKMAMQIQEVDAKRQ